MRAHVLPDARLARHAGRFVWLAIDTENPANAAFVEKFPIDVWPTFLVIDPSTEEVRARWPGSATAARLDRFLAEAARRVAPGGDVEARALALYADHDHAACVDAVRAGAPRMPRGPSFANAVQTGLACALALDEDDARRPGAIAALAPLAEEALTAPGVLADDRSGLYEQLVGAREAGGDAAGARALAERWWRFLEAEARRAPTPERRAFLDAARLGAAYAAGDPARAIAPLERSARELPRDYNPPARLARLYRDTGRLDDALAAARRALALAYGPRKLRVYELLVSIEDARGARAAARRAAEEAVAFARTLPGPQRNDAVTGRLERRIAEE